MSHRTPVSAEKAPVEASRSNGAGKHLSPGGRAWAPSEVSEVIEQPGAPLGPSARSVFQNRFGSLTLSDVRIHADDRAAASARRVDAAAYTVGSHIVLGRPEYARPNDGVLGHELTHVVQQRGRQPTGRIPIGAPDHPAEREAERSALTFAAPRFASNFSVEPMLQRQLFPPVPIVVGQRQRIPSGTANPGPGISISWNGDDIVILANLKIWGAAASPTIANEIKATIERYWNTSSAGNGHTYNIHCTANVRFRNASDNADGNATQIEVVRQGSTTASYVGREWLVGSRYMHFNLDRGTDWTPAHEFGHLLGLDDHYHKTARSYLPWNPAESEPDQGWASNIMGERGGTVDYRNAEELFNRYAYRTALTPQQNQGA